MDHGARSPPRHEASGLQRSEIGLGQPLSQYGNQPIPSPMQSPLEWSVEMKQLFEGM